MKEFFFRYELTWKVKWSMNLFSYWFRLEMRWETRFKRTVSSNRILDRIIKRKKFRCLEIFSRWLLMFYFCSKTQIKKCFSKNEVIFHADNIEDFHFELIWNIRSLKNIRYWKWIRRKSSLKWLSREILCIERKKIFSNLLSLMFANLLAMIKFNWF